MTLRERPDESCAGGEAVSEATIRNAGAPFFRYGEAETAYLKRRDAQLGAVIDRIGPIERKVAPDPFTALVECVVDQQISAKAARTVRERLDALAGDVTPERIAALSADEIQKCGMTMKKAVTIAGVATAVLSGELDPDALRTMSDDDVVTRLTALDGIGLWTAEMVLIFALGRRDVVSWGDLAIRRGMTRLYCLETLTRDEFLRYRRRYSPHGSVASLYLWALAAGR